MSLANITYQTLITAVSNYMTSNCKNVTDFAGMEACFKSGYSSTVSMKTGGDTYNPTATCTSSSNLVTSVASSTVTSEFNTFIGTLGITVTDNIPELNLVPFMNNIVSYCCSKLSFVTSQFSSNRWLIYKASGTKSSYLIHTNMLIYAKSVNDVLAILKDTINQNVRSLPVKYSYSFT